MLTPAQETLFQVSQQGYSLTTASSEDPQIVAAKRRNVNIPRFRVCHQIYKGKSKFVDSAAEEYYNSLINRQKVEMEKSQATMDCSQVLQASQLTVSKSHMTRSQHAPQTRCKTTTGRQSGHIFGDGLVEVTSENQIAEDPVELIKMRKMLAERDSQIAKYKQEIKAKAARQQALEQKLKLIAMIALSNDPKSGNTQNLLMKQLEGTSDLLAKIVTTNIKL